MYFNKIFAITLVFNFYVTSLNAEPYILNPGDKLKIHIMADSEIIEEVLITPDSKVNIGIIGEVELKSTSIATATEILKQKLAVYMKDEPQIYIQLVEASGYQIYVLGKVIKPGNYVINSNTDVVQALSLAGGLDTFAESDEIRIIRRTDDNNQEVFVFDYTEIIRGKALDQNIILKSRDIVIVP